MVSSPIQPGPSLGLLDFRDIVEHCPDGVAVLSGGDYVYMNPAWATQLQRSREELSGRPLVDDVHADEREALARWLAGRGPNERPVAEHRFLSASGELLTLQLSPVESAALVEHGLKGFIARDVTPLKRMQARLLLADRIMSVGALAAGVAHEINNPLSYVLGNLTFLEEECEPLLAAVSPGTKEELLEAVREAKNGAERVKRIVRDLQAFSRADQDSKVPIGVNRTIESAISMAFIEIRHRARLVKELREVPPVLANEARLGQVVLNLLLNAAHALPEGKADSNSIRISSAVDEDGRVVVEIEDTGPGIPPEILGHVFETFFTTKPLGVGTGLGLSIAHSIVTEMGGTIEAESRLGEGSKFSVRLPAAHQVLAAEAATDEEGAFGEARRRGRILVIDDEHLIASALKRGLKDHVVSVVTSGRQAVEILAVNQAFDLILCDLMMPELTGMDVYAWIRTQHPGLEERVVFMTGGIFTPRAQEFLARVSNQRIEKPFEIEAMRRFVADWVIRR